MKKDIFLEIINKIAPEIIAEEWDNCGMQIDLEKDEIKRVLITLEITDQVIEEAAFEKADMIITHHPLLFHPVKNIFAQNVNGSYIIKLIQNGISVYSAHTSFDSAVGGNNDYLAEQLGLTDYRIENPEPGNPESIIRIGFFQSSKPLKEVALKLSSCLNNPGGIRVAGNPDAAITKVGLCTGSAGEYYRIARAHSCDLYITGEIRHHELMEALEEGLCIIDAGHFGTENIFVENFGSQLKEKADDSLVIIESKGIAAPYNFTV